MRILFHLATRSEAIASRLEAIATSNKKLLGLLIGLLSFFDLHFCNVSVCLNGSLFDSPGGFEHLLARCSGCRVLDLGAGSGLLAMLAAEYGAQQVVALEATLSNSIVF